MIADTLSLRLCRIARLLLIPAAMSGCARSATEQPTRAPEAQRAYIGAGCAAMKEHTADAAPVGILLEVADVVEPIGAPARDWLSAHPVEVHHVAKISLPMTPNTRITSPFGTCLDRRCTKAEDTQLEVLMKNGPANASAPLQLQLTFTSGSGAPRHLSIETSDQQPALASTTSPEQTVVVTPYYLFEPKQHSMALLMQCAAQAPTAAQHPTH